MYQLICNIYEPYEYDHHNVIANLETLDKDNIEWLVNNHVAMDIASRWYNSYDGRRYYVVKQTIGNFMDTHPVEERVYDVTGWMQLNINHPLVYEYADADTRLLIDQSEPLTLAERIQDAYDTTISVCGKTYTAGMRAWTKRQRYQRRKARKSLNNR